MSVRVDLDEHQVAALSRLHGSRLAPPVIARAIGPLGAPTIQSLRGAAQRDPHRGGRERIVGRRDGIIARQAAAGSGVRPCRLHPSAAHARLAAVQSERGGVAKRPQFVVASPVPSEYDDRAKAMMICC
jgi:hypothetical protein